MKSKHFILLLFAVMMLPKLYPQKSQWDHRDRPIDSLEHWLATNPPTGWELAHVYRNLMWGYQQINVQKSMEYARKCVETAISINRYDFEAFGYMMLGLNYYSLLQYDSAMFYYHKVLEAAERMRNFPKEYSESDVDTEFSTAYGNIGNIYNMQSKYHEAIEYYQKALPIFEKNQRKERQALAYFNIGELYRSMDNYEQAEINFLKMDSLSNIVGDSLFIVWAKYGLSSLYVNTKEYEKALQNAEIAYNYSFSHPEEGEMKATILCILAEIFLEGFDDDKKAEDYAVQASNLYEELGLSDQNSAFLSLSKIHLKRGEWRKAEQTALAALEVHIDEPYNIVQIYKVLAKSYAYLGDAQKVGEYIEKLIELQSTWSNKNYQTAMREMETKYETGKKEFEIKALKSEKQLIMWLSIAAGSILLLGLVVLFFLWRFRVQKHRLAEHQVKQLQQEKQLIATQAVLDGEVQERSRLARDLHDGLGSMLSVLRLNLAKVKSAAKLEKENLFRFEKALFLLDDSIEEMRRVAHHLMPDALSRFGLKTALSDFLNTVPAVEFNYFGFDTRIDRKMELVIYLIIHELVNNSLKHANASHILVQLVQEKERIAIAVEDNGCGFDFKTTTSGTGINNIRTRVASFGGVIDMRSTVGKGTEVNVEMRIK